MEAKAYHVEFDDDGRQTLYGPNHFECFLGEPEDCTWTRDGRDAVERLNQQHEALDSLASRYARAIEALRGCIGWMEEQFCPKDTNCVNCAAGRMNVASARAVLEETP